MVASGVGWCKQPATEHVGQTPIGFLGKRRRQIAGAKPGFDVGDGHARVKRRQGRREDRSRVALNDYDVIATAGQQRRNPVEDAGRDVRQRLAGLHDFQIVIGPYAEELQHRQEHRPMLRRRTDLELEMIIGPQRQTQRRELDGLRPCTDDNQHPKHAAA